MTPAEIRCTREHLGLSHTDLAAILQVDPRSVRRWETGEQTIRDSNAAALIQIVDITASTVRRHVISLRGLPQPELIIYRCDEDMWADHPQFAPFPARWHRIIAARVMAQVPGLIIRYRVFRHTKVAASQSQEDGHFVTDGYRRYGARINR